MLKKLINSAYIGGLGGTGFGVGLGRLFGTGAGVMLTPGVVPVESLLAALDGEGISLVRTAFVPLFFCERQASRLYTQIVKAAAAYKTVFLMVEI
jgi:hypothetical protein